MLMLKKLNPGGIFTALGFTSARVAADRFGTEKKRKRRLTRSARYVLRDEESGRSNGSTCLLGELDIQLLFMVYPSHPYLGVALKIVSSTALGSL